MYPPLAGRELGLVLVYDPRPVAFEGDPLEVHRADRLGASIQSPFTNFFMAPGVTVSHFFLCLPLESTLIACLRMSSRIVLPRAGEPPRGR